MSEQKEGAANWRPTADKNIRLKRARMLQRIRAFFVARDVIEVETPLLSHYVSTDPHIDSLHAICRGQQCHLNTSPEYAMKRLLADDPQAIYQICKAFRDDALSPLHNPEFTMLEWYRPDFDMQQLMAELSELVEILCLDSEVVAQFEYISYQQAFENSVGFNPHQTTTQSCQRYCLQSGVEIPQGLKVSDALDDWLDWLLTQVVLPTFKVDGFTFLYDYPASQCCLAKIEYSHQQAVARRFELFYGEIELANGFYELTDARQQLQRFQQENERRQQASKPGVDIDKHLIAALAHGLPECAGVAVGLDRLLMVLTDISAIEKVLSFSWQQA